MKDAWESGGRTDARAGWEVQWINNDGCTRAGRGKGQIAPCAPAGSADRGRTMSPFDKDGGEGKAPKNFSSHLASCCGTSPCAIRTFRSGIEEYTV